MREGEAYGAGSDVPETLLGAEKKTRTMPVLGREGEPARGAALGWGRGMGAAER